MSVVKYVRPEESRVRAPRMDINSSLVVDSKTLGTSINYRLTTKNVSKSGLLLSWGNETHVPFIVNTLIEMTIDPGGRWLTSPVPCLGKVVRREEEGPQGASFGIRIIQIDNSDLEAWEKCVLNLEKEAKQFTSKDEFNTEDATSTNSRFDSEIEAQLESSDLGGKTKRQATGSSH